ncbi:MAG: T9SS type A sorting domain-containing protein [Algoriphagus sp.]|nr:T9SS type A sorting domain-containing protein [Algoriphagus sp.]
MFDSCFLLCLEAFFACRIYRIFLAVVITLLCIGNAFCQEIGAYKTVATGDFPNIGIWSVWNGSSWIAATVKPGMANDIYIDQNHTLRLTGNEEVKSVFINAETGAGQKLNLNGRNLDVHGTLQAFTGPAPGIAGNAWNSQNWIGTSQTSTITFKGSSRTILDQNSWSAQTTQSRFGVIFDPGPGIELIVNAPIKALSFTVRSGTVIQRLDTTVNPAVCHTFSFNTETTVYGTGPFGEFIIEDGATLISECNSNLINRSTSGSVSALNFELQNGGSLILEGNQPRIEAANFQLNGNLIFRGGSSSKSFLASSFPDAATPNSVRNVELRSSQNLTLPSQLFLLGNLIKSGTGNINSLNTHLIIFGSGNQEIQGFSLVTRDLTLNKSGGLFYPRNHLTIERNLTLTQGRMDLQGNNLNINTSLSGGLAYSGGSWRNVGNLTLFGLPPTLTASNASFPFEDVFNGGIRKVQLSGPSPGGSISIRFLEYKGANHDPNFTDTDSTPILYQLYSHFQFSELTPSTQSVELRLSAADLIVDNVDDLRVVGTGQPAPGTHLPGSDASLLWARRTISWDDLSGFNFTIGSYRELTILPVTWLGVEVLSEKEGNLIKWSLGQEKENLLFEIHRSKIDPISWEKIASTGSRGDSNTPITYTYLDTQSSRFENYLYRIRQISLDGSESWSTAARTFIQDEEKEVVIFPNPYQSGPLQIYIVEDDSRLIGLTVFNPSGKIISRQTAANELPEELMATLPAGVYFIQLEFSDRVVTKRFIKL